MEKIFRPNRIFVIFCLLLIFVWVGLQYVSTLRVSEAAREEAQQIFDWNWPGQLISNAEITDVSVLGRTENEAKVRVKARQTLTKLAAADEKQSDKNQPETQPAGGAAVKDDIACVLTLYRSDRKWVLGKVEFD